MHYPEMWGVVEFKDLSIAADSAVVEPEREEHAAWTLRNVYYAQREVHGETGAFTPFRLKLDLDAGKLDASWVSWPPSLHAEADSFAASVRVSSRGTLNIDQTGRLWWSD